LIKKDVKVGSSEAVLCTMLGIHPFSYSLKAVAIYDAGNVYSPSVLKLSESEILNRFLSGVRNIAALSLGLGLPTQASVPHSIANGFKNLVALAVGADYDFEQAATLIQMIKNPEAFVVAAPVAKVEEKKAAVVESDEEGSDEEIGGFDMFG
jgi:large subunit ribosomal protein LP0